MRDISKTPLATENKTYVTLYHNNQPVAQMEWQVCDSELSVYVHKIVRKNGKNHIQRPLAYMLGHNALQYSLK